MWTRIETPLATGEGARYSLLEEGQPLSAGRAIELWRTSSGFRQWFNSVLAQCPYPAFRWETPPLCLATAESALEFVLISRPGLARRADDRPFREHFNAAKNGGVAVFSSLGGDALLIAPCPGGESSAYAHLGAFVRHAPTERIDSLWQAVGEQLQQRLGHRPVWLNTAGGGVAWLHVRLDDTPKYYAYAPFRNPRRLG